MAPSSQKCCVVTNCCCCCCCGCNLKTGSLFYGWLTLISDIIIIIINGYFCSQDEGPGTGLWLVWVTLGITIVQLVVSILLLVGISKNNAQFIKVFVFVNSAILVLIGMAGILSFVAFIVHLVVDAVFLVIFIIAYSLGIYYTVVVHSYAISLEENPMQPILPPYQVIVEPIAYTGQLQQPGAPGQVGQSGFQPVWQHGQTGMQPGQPIMQPVWQHGQTGLQPVQPGDRYPGWHNLQPEDTPPAYKA